MRHRPSIWVYAALALTASAPLAAQTTNYTLHMATVNTSAPGTVSVPVYLDSNGPDVDGWSFGVCHDPAEATLVSVVDGSTSAAPCGSFPFFNSVALYADGFTVGYVID